MIHNKNFFRQLISRYLEGRVTAKEKQSIEKWLNEERSPDLFGQLAENEQNNIGERIFSKIRTGMKEEKGGWHHIVWNWSYRVAAAIALLITVYLVWQFAGVYPAQEMVRITASESIRKAILADGSIIWLKPHSTLTYPQTFTGQGRAVTLEGAALFEVAKDPEHPFVIQCEGLRTTVLGTSFNIRSGKNTIEVTVLTGKVSLTSAKNPEGIVVLPNETAIFRKALHQLSRAETKKGTRAMVVAGTEYDMKFEDVPVRDIASRIEEKFEVKVRTEGSMDKCLFTADLTDKSLEVTLDIITSLLGATYKLDGDQVVLQGTGCE